MYAQPINSGSFVVAATYFVFIGDKLGFSVTSDVKLMIKGEAETLINGSIILVTVSFHHL